MKTKVLILALFLLAGCTVPDKEIREDIAAQARKDLNFIGLTITVNKGVVNVTGRCPSEKAFAGVRKTLKSVHVAKAINYHVEIAPVILNELTPTKISVDSVLSGYPLVITKVDTSGIILKGQVDSKQKAKMLEALHKNGLGAIKDSTTSL